MRHRILTIARIMRAEQYAYQRWLLSGRKCDLWRRLLLAISSIDLVAV